MPSKFKYAGNALGYVNVLEALLEAPYTIDELVKLSGLAYNTVRKFTHALHRRERVYVAVWRTDRFGRHTRPAFVFGRQPDVPRPPRKTATQRSAARRARQALALLTSVGELDVVE